MEQGIKIYGTHTGGWGSTSEEDDAHIYYAVGRLSRSDLTIDGVYRCDGRPGLFWVIVDSRGPWGLDFPFALPAWTYQMFSHRDWPDLLEFAEAVGIMERPSLGGNPRIAQTLVKEHLAVLAAKPSLSRTELMRQVTKRLRRLSVILTLGVLDDDDLRGLIAQLFAESVDALSDS